MEPKTTHQNARLTEDFYQIGQSKSLLFCSNIILQILWSRQTIIKFSTSSVVVPIC